jgi:hypothetical protein
LTQDGSPSPNFTSSARNTTLFLLLIRH